MGSITVCGVDEHLSEFRTLELGYGHESAQKISTHLPEKEHWSLQCSLFHRLSASLSARGQPIGEKALASVVAFAIKKTLDTFHQDLPRLDEDQRRRFLEIAAFDHANCLVTSLVSGQDKRNIELLVSEWLRIHGDHC